ncbi:MAG: hypothetical protein F4169_17050, partial [Gammaproteobacteria bacterium]|nr:hypothetical protein [Gammaproteobacteria bacterium]
MTMGVAHSAIARRVRAFVEDTRAGATAIASAALTVMTVGAAALITDHVWLVDQRDVLKTAAEAASIAATLDIDRQLAKSPRISDADLQAALEPVARRFVLANLAHLAPERFKRAKKSLEVELDLDRAQRTVGVTARADLGGTLFSRNLPMLGSYKGPEKVAAHAGVESESTPVEVVLAVDISNSMSRNLAGKSGSAGDTRSRMAIVKRAATNLVAILDPNGYNRVAVGIVPWHRYVRVDPARWSREGWAAYPARRTYPEPYECSGDGCAVTALVQRLPASPPEAWRGCLDGHRIYAGTSEVPEATADGLFDPPSAGAFAQSYFPPEKGRSHQCLAAAELPAGATNECYETKPASWAQSNCFARQPALFALSTERAAIERAVDALAPQGFATFSTLGVLWAQRMLEPAWKGVWGAGGIHPADAATPEHASLRKAIVLLTDGEDNYCHPKPACEGSPLAVSRTEACAAAKAQGTEVFVVAAMAPTRVTQALGQGLRACSSESDRDYPRGTRRAGATYVFLNNATPEALEAAFTDIANQLR